MRLLRSESKINFWPAYADLMAVLAIVGMVSLAVYADKGGGILKWIEIRKEVDTVSDNIRAELANNGVKVIETADGIVLPESVLKFESGKAEPMMDHVTKNMFEKLCLAIKKGIDSVSDGRQKFCVVIEGHTDSQQISATLARYYPSNWELSAARATYVLRMMSSEVYDLDPERYQMRAIGFGDRKPIEKNKVISPINRRIEIRIIPNYEAIEKTFPDKRRSD